MAEKKKILYIVEAMGGGVFTYIVDLANELVNKYDMYIAYAVRKQTPKNYKDYFDKRIHLIEVKNFRRAIDPMKDIAAFFEVKKIAAEIKPDIIHLHSSKAGAIGRMAFNGKIPMFYLITVDVVCRAVPSPLIFRKYVEYQKKVLSDNIKTVRFRDKHYGYKYSTMNVITDRNHGNYHQGVESDPWLRAFFSNICDRPSCHSCHFRKQYRVSDFTIWDCFNVGRFSKELDNDKGATRVLVHTKKGREIFNAIKNDFSYVEIAPEAAVAGAKEMKESVAPNEKRESFFKDANRMSGEELFNKYFPETFKVKVEHCIRLTCYKLGIYSAAKKIYVRLTHKY